MSVTRYDFFDGVGEAAVDSEGGFVSYDDYKLLSDKLVAELKAVWAEHFLLSRENATLLKERISLSRDVQRLTRELAEMKALLEPRVVPVRVWQD